MVAKKCGVGCICGKHRDVKNFCIEGCGCKRHTPSSNQQHPKCKVGCECKKHILRECLEGCLCMKHVAWNKDQRLSEEHRNSISKSAKGRVSWNKGVKGYKTNYPTQRKKRILPFDQRHPKCVEGCSCGRHNNIAYVRTFISNNSPNIPEKRVLELAVPYGFKFVGDGNFYIGTLNPDFYNGEDKVIEMFGDYWHKGENPQDRIDFFNERGYSCLVIWESDLKNIDKVLQRIISFSSGR